MSRMYGGNQEMTPEKGISALNMLKNQISSARKGMKNTPLSKVMQQGRSNRPLSEIQNKPSYSNARASNKFDFDTLSGGVSTKKGGNSYSFSRSENNDNQTQMNENDLYGIYGNNARNDYNRSSGTLQNVSKPQPPGRRPPTQRRTSSRNGVDADSNIRFGGSGGGNTSNSKYRFDMYEEGDTKQQHRQLRPGVTLAEETRNISTNGNKPQATAWTVEVSPPKSSRSFSSKKQTTTTGGAMAWEVPVDPPNRAERPQLTQRNTSRTTTRTARSAQMIRDELNEKLAKSKINRNTYNLPQPPPEDTPTPKPQLNQYSNGEIGDGSSIYGRRAVTSAFGTKPAVTSAFGNKSSSSFTNFKAPLPPARGDTNTSSNTYAQVGIGEKYGHGKNSNETKEKKGFPGSSSYSFPGSASYSIPDDADPNSDPTQFMSGQAQQQPHFPMPKSRSLSQQAHSTSSSSSMPSYWNMRPKSNRLPNDHSSTKLDTSHTSHTSNTNTHAQFAKRTSASTNSNTTSWNTTPALRRNASTMVQSGKERRTPAQKNRSVTFQFNEKHNSSYFRKQIAGTPLPFDPHIPTHGDESEDEQQADRHSYSNPFSTKKHLNLSTVSEFGTREESRANRNINNNDFSVTATASRRNLRPGTNSDVYAGRDTQPSSSFGTRSGKPTSIHGYENRYTRTGSSYDGASESGANENVNAFGRDVGEGGNITAKNSFGREINANSNANGYGREINSAHTNNTASVRNWSTGNLAERTDTHTSRERVGENVQSSNLLNNQPRPYARPEFTINSSSYASLNHHTNPSQSNAQANTNVITQPSTSYMRMSSTQTRNRAADVGEVGSVSSGFTFGQPVKSAGVSYEDDAMALDTPAATPARGLSTRDSAGTYGYNMNVRGTTKPQHGTTGNTLPSDADPSFDPLSTLNTDRFTGGVPQYTHDPIPRSGVMLEENSLIPIPTVNSTAIFPAGTDIVNNVVNAIDKNSERIDVLEQHMESLSAQLAVAHLDPSFVPEVLGLLKGFNTASHRDLAVRVLRSISSGVEGGPIKTNFLSTHDEDDDDLNDTVYTDALEFGSTPNNIPVQSRLTDIEQDVVSPQNCIPVGSKQLPFGMTPQVLEMRSMRMQNKNAHMLSLKINNEDDQSQSENLNPRLQEIYPHQYTRNPAPAYRATQESDTRQRVSTTQGVQRQTHSQYANNVPQFTRDDPRYTTTPITHSAQRRLLMDPTPDKMRQSGTNYNQYNHYQQQPVYSQEHKQTHTKTADTASAGDSSVSNALYAAEKWGGYMKDMILHGQNRDTVPRSVGVAYDSASSTLNGRLSGDSSKVHHSRVGLDNKAEVQLGGPAMGGRLGSASYGPGVTHKGRERLSDPTENEHSLIPNTRIAPHKSLYNQTAHLYTHNTTGGHKKSLRSELGHEETRRPFTRMYSNASNEPGMKFSTDSIRERIGKHSEELQIKLDHGRRLIEETKSHTIVTPTRVNNL
eukprot:CFRG0746T1